MVLSSRGRPGRREWSFRGAARGLACVPTAAVRFVEEATGPAALQTHRSTATAPGSGAGRAGKADGATAMRTFISVSLRFSLVNVFHCMNHTGTEVHVQITDTHPCLHGGGLWASGPRAPGAVGVGGRACGLGGHVAHLHTCRGWCAGPEPGPTCLPKSLRDPLPKATADRRSPACTQRCQQLQASD